MIRWGGNFAVEYALSNLKGRQIRKSLLWVHYSGFLTISSIQEAQVGIALKERHVTTKHGHSLGL